MASAPPPADAEVEPLCGLRVKLPRRLPVAEMQALLQGFAFYPLDSLHTIASEALESTDPTHAWATMVTMQLLTAALSTY
jgi:hypothetical protein